MTSQGFVHIWVLHDIPFNVIICEQGNLWQNGLLAYLIFVQKIKTQENGTFLSTEENERGGIIRADGS